MLTRATLMIKIHGVERDDHVVINAFEGELEVNLAAAVQRVCENAA